MTFEERLEYGKEGEDEVYNYLMQKGWSLIPTVPFKEDKGQRVYRLKNDYPSTDTIAFRKGISKWIEVKHKTHPSFYNGAWTVGMDKYYFSSYYRMQEDSGIDVSVFFLIDVSTHEKPFGLYDRSLSNLCGSVHSESKHSLFWDIAGLRKLSFYQSA